MKRFTVLATAIAVGLAFMASAKTYTPVFTEDFESASAFASGWTWNGNAHEQAERTLIDGTTKSRFLHITGTKYERGDFSFNSDCTALTDYRLEFDWFANMGFNDKTCRLYVYTGDSVLFQIADPNARSSSYTTGYLYLKDADPSDTANAAATFTTAGRGADCTNTLNQSRWYHIIITANETDGVFLRIASQDSSVGTVYNARISDFANATKIAFTADSSNYDTYGGIDNIVFSEGVSQSFVWTGAEGDSKWSTPGNWTVDGVAQTEKYPEIGDFVSGVDETVLAALDVAVKLETSDGVTRFAYIADKSEKTWSAQGADTRWTTLGNWVYTQGGFAVYEAPARGDTLTFPASLPDGTEVSFSGNVDQDNDTSGYALVVDGKVSFVSTSNAQRSFHSVKSISGSGVLSLDNVIIRTMTYQTLPVSCAIAVDGPVKFYARGDRAAVNMSAALSGQGTLSLASDGNGRHVFTFSGDMSGFRGTFEVPKAIRNNTTDTPDYSLNFNGDDSTINLSVATVSIADPMTLTLGGTYTGNILKIGALTGAGTINNKTANAMTLQVGNDETDAESAVVLAAREGTDGWTVSKVGANTQSLTDATVAYNVSVSAGTLALPVGKALGTVAVSGGALGFAADSEWVENTPHTLFTYSTWDNPSGAAITLDQSAFDTVHSVSYDFGTAGTVSLTLSEAVFVWNGGASGRWDDASNWLLDGSAAVSAPTYQNKVTINGATVSVDVSAELSDVTLSNGAKIAVMFDDETLAFTIPSGMAAADFVAAGPYTAEANDGVLTATRVSSTFTWAGGVSGEWTDAANWLVGGGCTAVLPGEDDDVSIATAAEITFADAAYAKSVTLNADATFSGTSIQCPQYSGDGTLSVAGIKLTAPREGNFYIDVPMSIVEGTENTFTLESSIKEGSADYRYIYFGSAISGSGDIVLDQRKRAGLAAGKFSGDNSQFSGSVTVINCQSVRDLTDFTGANSTSSDAVYTVYGRSDKKGNVFTSANTTYGLGALNGNVYQQSANNVYNPVGITLEIGNLNEDCSFGGDLGYNRTAIRKVGTARLTCSADNIGNVEIAGGTYEVTANTQNGNIKFTGDGVFRSTPEASSKSEIDYAAKFVGSTEYPIVFDDGDTNRTWASAIPASNKAGFTKLGAGTLTLQKTPLYTGWTTVKAGRLVVPDGTVLDVIGGAGGTIQGAKIRNLKFAEGATVVAGAERWFTTGTADVSNLTIYIADPAAAMSKTVVKAGSITGTPTLAFPEGTSEALKARWSLESSSGRIRVSSVEPFTLILR